MSSPSAKHDLRAVASRFRIAGDFRDARPWGSGHINDTYSVAFDQAGTPVRYILQRINHNVFRNPRAVMENIVRVLEHLQRKLAARGADDASRRALTLVPACDGLAWHTDPEGNWWRCYFFVEQATTFDQIENTRQAAEAARAFGEFQGLLADLPAPRLHDTIPHFHHTRSRFDALRAALAEDKVNRAARVKDEIAFALAREPIVDVLLAAQAAGSIPERVTHNDTKLNNVMLDDATGEGICVIDLDTVMPGLALYDFGDMCRTATRPTPEDERDLTKIVMRMDMFEALVRGYLSAAGRFLTAGERAHLAFSARLITFEIGLRFLTDFLQGDVYFKVRREDHNRDRCRVQFRMVEEFERRERDMERAVAEA